MIRDLLLDPVTIDLAIERGDVVWLDVGDPRAVAQDIYYRLMTFLGEWFLDQRIGFPWFQEVLGKGLSQKRVEQRVKETLESVPGVRRAERVALNLDKGRRELTLSWVAIFDDGKQYSSEDFLLPFIIVRAPE